MSSSQQLTVTIADASGLAQSPHKNTSLAELSRILVPAVVSINSNQEMTLSFSTESEARAWVDDKCKKFPNYVAFAVGVDEQDTMGQVFLEFRIPEPLFQMITYISDGKSTFDGTTWAHQLKTQFCERVLGKV